MRSERRSRRATSGSVREDSRPVVDYANAESIAGLKAAGLGDFSAEHAPRVTPEEAKAQFPRSLRGG